MDFDDLPDSWIKINLGEFFDKLQYGYTASASEKNDKIKLLRITDLQDRLVNWENVPGCEI